MGKITTEIRYAVCMMLIYGKTYKKYQLKIFKCWNVLAAECRL